MPEQNDIIKSYKEKCLNSYIVYKHIKIQEAFIMTIDKQINGSELTLSLTGRLDTTTAPELEAVIKENIGGVTNLVMDFAGLEYLSSAGLRVILSAQKTMNKQGEMVIRNVNETINEVFEITGFIDILTIE